MKLDSSRQNSYKATESREILDLKENDSASIIGQSRESGKEMESLHIQTSEITTNKKQNQ